MFPEIYALDDGPIALDIRPQQEDESFVGLPILPKPAWDNDADQQIPQAPWLANIASDSGQDTTNLILLPKQNLDTDAENQRLQDPLYGLQYDNDEGWTKLIILPGFDPQFSPREDMESVRVADPTSSLAEYEDVSRVIVLPQQNLDTDADQQRLQDGLYGVQWENDESWTKLIILPGFDPQFSPREDMESYPSPDPISRFAEYEDVSKVIVLPFNDWTTDAQHQLPSPPFYGFTFDNDEGWTKLIVVITVVGHNIIVAGMYNQQVSNINDGIDQSNQ